MLLHLLETNVDAKRTSERGDVLNRWSEGNGIYYCTFMHLSEIVEEWPERCDRVQLMCSGPKEFSRKLTHGVQMCEHVCMCTHVCLYTGACVCVGLWVHFPAEMKFYGI